MSRPRRRWACLDCSVDTGRALEHYFIHTPTWLSVVGTTRGMLCVGCLETRLGRRLTPDDFPKVTINDPSVTSMSARLLSRIRGET